MEKKSFKNEINKKQKKKNRKGGRVSISQPIEYQIIKWIKIARNLEIAIIHGIL